LEKNDIGTARKGKEKGQPNGREAVPSNNRRWKKKACDVKKMKKKGTRLARKTATTPEDTAIERNGDQVEEVQKGGHHSRCRRKRRLP